MDAHPATDESASLPVWLPAEGAPLVRCGVYFDAVRVPRRLGEDVLAVLGEHSGPVIESYPDLRLVWLVPPGTLCSRPPAYHVYGEGCRIEIPPAEPDLTL